MPRPLAYAILALLFLWSAVVQGRNIASAFGHDEARDPIHLDPYSDRVTKPRPEAAFAGVLERDRVLNIDGAPYVGLSVLATALERHHAGERLVVRIAPDDGGAPRDVPIVLAAAGKSGLAEIVLVMVMPAFSLILGFIVVALRPRDLRAWLLLGMMAGFASLATNDIYSWQDGIRQAAIVFYRLFLGLWPAFMALFGIYFPDRLALDRRRPWLKWTLVVPLFLLAVVAVFDSLGASEDFRAFLRFHAIATSLTKVDAALVMLGIFTFFTLLGMRRGAEQSPDARRRLRFLIVGGEAALVPSGVMFMSQVFFGSFIERRIPWIILPAYLCLCIFPLTLAYVIVVHRAMDVRVAVRQGLQYALLRGGIRVLQGAVIIVASIVVARADVRPLQRFTMVGFAAVFAVRSRQAGDKLRGWIDRRFFREAVNTEHLLGELGESVRGIREMGPLLEVVARSLSESLHIPRVAVLLGNGAGFCPQFSLGIDGWIPCLPEGGSVAQKLIASGPQRVYFDDAASWIQSASSAEQVPLRALDSQLLLPMLVKDRLPGIISLGPKQSEEPYSASDLRLLESVATQTGLALENARLTAAMADEIAQRERLNREIEIAREVQERLFPQDSPAIPGFDYCGYCRPALGVGGDYYDFVPQSEGRLGIAIGDVSGKGIAAALLMASLQASLRGQTLGLRADLSVLMRHVNKLVYDASSSNRYATFFYAEYDPQTRMLTYVNAGHNPPVIIRGAGVSAEAGAGVSAEAGAGTAVRAGAAVAPSQVIRLEAGGAVVGLLQDFAYGQGEILLQDGDVFLGFTDGISESMDPEDEEWGEDAMIVEAQSCVAQGLHSRAILDRLFQAADAFARGAKQHDDMTLVVGRVYSNA